MRKTARIKEIRDRKDGLLDLVLDKPREIKGEPALDTSLSAIQLGCQLEIRNLEYFYQFVSERTRKAKKLDKTLLKPCAPAPTSKHGDIVLSEWTDQQKRRLIEAWEPFGEGMWGDTSDLRRFRMMMAAEPLTKAMIVAIRDLESDYGQTLDQVTIVHTVALLEGFVKDYLREFFSRRPKYLSSKKELSFEVLRSVKSKNHLIWLLVDKEVSSIDTSIDGLHDYLARRFGVDLKGSFGKVPELEQMKALRNSLIHDYRRADRSNAAPWEEAIKTLGDGSRQSIVVNSLKVAAEFVSSFHHAFVTKLKLVK